MRQILGGKFWVEETNHGEAQLGLTKEFLAHTGIIWNLFHSESPKFNVGDCFINFESSKMLMSLRSPISAVVVKWNTKIFVNPSSLDETTPLVFIKQ